MIFGFFTLLVAIILSGVAAYYSILGLTAIFSAAVLPVIIMGAALELGKINATVWLHKNWNRAQLHYKLYLIPAVVFLMLLTSMGIFGFLSKAHSDQSLVSGNNSAQLALIDEKIKIQRENIATARSALQQLDAQVNERLSRGTSEQGVERAAILRRQQANERTKLLKDVSDAQNIIQKLNEERAPIAADFRKVEAEVGPIKYIAALIYEDNVDSNTLEKAVRWVIILIVIVFDPLAIVLILAGTLHLEWWSQERKLKKKQKEELATIPDKPIDMPEEKTIETEFCPKCNTALVNATGIGPFCPNKKCDVVDGVYLPQPIEVTETSNITAATETVVVPKIESVTSVTEAVIEKKESSEELIETNEPIEQIVQPESEEKKFDIAESAQDTIEQQLEAKSIPKPPREIIPETMDMRKIGPVSAADDQSINKIAITADNDIGTVNAVKAHFGTTFPDSPEKGELYLRVDYLPSRLFKYNGRKWIEVEKGLTDSYIYNDEYIKYLVSEIDSGRYDIDDLSDSERQQISEFLKKGA